LAAAGKTWSSASAGHDESGPHPVRQIYRIGKSEQFLASVEAMSPFGRLGQPAEIAAVVAFLAGDAASWVTAQNTKVNGGTVWVVLQPAHGARVWNDRCPGGKSGPVREMLVS
jgi:NAD(P)-dependent dehydrogenase (short-subunit alcohol dehydrogenase family)